MENSNKGTLMVENQVQQNGGKTKWEKIKLILMLLRNGLAAWAGLLIIYFLSEQSRTMWNAFKANAADAFAKTTSAKMVVLMLLGAIVLTALHALIKKVKFPKRKRKVKK